jgi:hypothetical protein
VVDLSVLNPPSDQRMLEYFDEHSDDLMFLMGRGHARAQYIGVRALADRGGIVGSDCDWQEYARAIYEANPGRLFEYLSQYDAKRQAEVLEYFDLFAPLDWETERDQFLRGNPIATEAYYDRAARTLNESMDRIELLNKCLNRLPLPPSDMQWLRTQIEAQGSDLLITVRYGGNVSDPQIRVRKIARPDRVTCHLYVNGNVKLEYDLRGADGVNAALQLCRHISRAITTTDLPADPLDSSHRYCICVGEQIGMVGISSAEFGRFVALHAELTRSDHPAVSPQVALEAFSTTTVLGRDAVLTWALDVFDHLAANINAGEKRN